MRRCPTNPLLDRWVKTTEFLDGLPQTLASFVILALDVVCDGIANAILSLVPVFFTEMTHV